MDLLENLYTTSVADLFVYYLLEKAFASLDFLRAAVFFFSIPRFTALSIALYAIGRSPSASFAFGASATFFIASFIARIERRLYTRFVSACLADFFPDLLVAIDAYNTKNPTKHKRFRTQHTTLPFTYVNTGYLSPHTLYYRYMLAQLTGTVSYSDNEYLVLDVNGVGYKVYTSPDVLLSATDGNELRLWVHLVVKDTALDLYGFFNRRDLRFFELLIAISGVGPKSALGILSLADVDTLTQAINDGDATYLTKVSGIGSKIAKKIILELSDKVETVMHSNTQKEDVDTLDALTTMGYSTQEARLALKKVPKDIHGASARLKEALKTLSS